jgi:MoxR-like ATPase
MKPSELFEALHALITERVPLHIWGACGVGKSQIVAQVASDLGWQFLDIRAVQLDPVDLRGLPRISADQAEWVPPKFLPTSGKGILFLDELTAAPQMTQAGCYQLVLDRKLGEYHLPDDWVVVAAGNPASERGVHFSMPRPLRNRFVHLSLEPDFEDWCQWAVRAGLRPEIIAFLRFKPALLHDANTMSDMNAWPTPRSWEMASNVLSGFARRQKSGFFAGATEIEAQLLEGTVGPAATTELVAFLRLFRDLPSIDEILLNPDTAPLPGEPIVCSLHTSTLTSPHRCESLSAPSTWERTSRSAMIRVTWPKFVYSIRAGFSAGPSPPSWPARLFPCGTSFASATAVAKSFGESFTAGRRRSMLSSSSRKGRPLSKQAPVQPANPKLQSASSDIETNDASFVETSEHCRFVEFCDACRQYRYIGLCYGPPGVGKTLSARRYSRADLLIGIDPWLDPPLKPPLPDTIFYTTAVINTPARVASDLSHARERLTGIAVRPIEREAHAVLEEIRLRDEARPREILEKPGCSPCDRPAVDPVYFQTYQFYQARKKEVSDPTTLIVVDEADRLQMNSL